MKKQCCENCGHRVPAAVSRNVGDLGQAMTMAKKNKRYACINGDLELVIVFAKGEDYTKGSCECWTSQSR